MKEQQKDYLELVQQLLNCESGQEPEILAANEELVDEGLVATVLAVAQVLEEWEDPETAGIVAWLHSLAEHLAQELRLSNGENALKGQLEFLMTVLQVVSDSQGDPQVVYPVLKQKLELLDESLVGLLQAWIQETFAKLEPEQVRSIAVVIGNFGNLVQDFPLGDKAINMDLAIACYEILTEIFTIDTDPEIWATIQNNCASAYSDRIKGDRAENLELAITGYNASLQVYTRADFPIDWASTQNNRANAYSDRIKGDRAENLELAIAGYEASLQVRTRDDFPIQWAMTQNNRANAYSDRIKGKFLWHSEAERAENLELAISGYNSSLEVYTREAFPIDWAMTQNNRANAYLERIKGEFRWNSEAERAENLGLAISGYEAALQVRTPKTLPIECLQTARNLGNLHFNQGQWQQAIRAYELAMEAAETSRSWAIDDDRRQEILKEALSVYENAIQCAVNLQNYPQAIQYTERIRSRQLVELIASKDLYSNAQVPAEIQAYLQEYQQLNQAIENLQSGSEALSLASEQIQQAETRKQWLYKKIRAYDPVLAGQITVGFITYPEIQQLITDHTAILICYSLDDDTLIFTIKVNQEPELFICKGQGKQELQNCLIPHTSSDVIQERSENLTQQYFSHTSHTLQNKEVLHFWQYHIPEVLSKLTYRLQINQLITNHLESITELVIVPHLLLHQIPFAALPTEQGFLGERFTLRFVPSCQILQYCQQRPKIESAIQGIVEDADGTLPGARYEGHKIAEIYQVKEGDRLRGQTQATIANYRQLLGRVNRLHSVHHATSRLDNPQESALQLADGHITLGDLLLGERYPHLDEVFLSACATHVGNLTLTDDVTTLATGFLCIGARSVQSTLWSVNDLVTALFDIFYHQERREGYDCATSLQRAQLRLRQLSGKEFSLNYYPEIKRFLDGDLEAIGQQLEELKQAKKTAVGADLTKIKGEIQQQETCYRSLETLEPMIQSYCQQEYPFAAPFYWAGFICQGMA